jgi:Tol biopolymer transport system component
MSPEQARGKGNVDKRADIWAFGVVLYEMLTARRLFEGEDAGETLASVIKAEPKWDGIPASVRPLLERCLQKDPRKRLRDIGDMSLLLEPAAPAGASASQPSARRFRWAWAAAALFALSTGVLGFVHLREKAPEASTPIRFEVAPPDKSTIDYVALSPDGRRLALTSSGPDGRRALWVRSLDALGMQKLPGTEGSAAPLTWSPDSRYVAFGLQGKLQKIDPSGGPPETICSLSGGFLGLTWNQQGVILFASRQALYRVSAAGGDPVAVTATDTRLQEAGQGWPAFLPDGKHFLYFRLYNTGENTGIYLGSLDAKPDAQDDKRLLDANSGAVFSGSAAGGTGSLLYVRGDALMARPFDPARREFTGDAARLADRVGVTGNYGGLFTVSANGLLGLSTGGSPQRQLTWYDRQGKVLGHAGELATRDEISLSPDGTRVAEGRTDAKGAWVVWLLDLARGTNTRFTFDAAGAGNATWSPDGSQIIYAPSGGQSTDLYRKPASGAGKEQKVLHTEVAMTPQDWSRDGRFLLYVVRGKDTGADLWVLPDPGKAAGDSKPVPYLVTPQAEAQAQFSPDGQFVVYTSNESGISEIYVRPFPASAGGKWLISNGGGTQARWRPDGKELFYLTPDATLMAVEVSTKPDFRAGVPKPLFRVPVTGGVGGAPGIAWRWDVSPDGQRFLVNTAPEDRSSTPVTVVANWGGLLKR